MDTKLKPDMPHLETLKEALVAFRDGDMALARDLAETILKQAPDDAGALRILGQITYLEDQPGAAAGLLEKSLKAKPEQYSIWIKLGNIYTDLADQSAAIGAFTEAIKHSGDPHLGHFWRAQSLAAISRDQEAWDDLDETVRLNSTYGPAYRLMGLLGHPAASTADWEQNLLSKLANRLFAREDAIHVHFALAGYYEKAAEPAKMWDHLGTANGLQKNLAPGWAASYGHIVARSKEIFTPDFLSQALTGTDLKITPIFIVGLPRSGSTLLEQMLAAHKHVGSAGEAQFIPRIVTHIQREVTFLNYPDGVEGFAREDFEALLAVYQDGIATLAGGHEFATDKLLSNGFFIGLIYMIMPTAKVIHIRRDPLDTAFSIYKNYFWEQQSPEFCSLADIGAYARLNQDNLAHWKAALPGFIHEVSYEALVKHPEAELKKITGFCGLPWDAACLDHQASTAGAQTLSTAQVKKPLYQTSIGSAAEFADRLAPFTEALEK